MNEMRIVVENYTLSNKELETRMNIIKDRIKDIAKNGLEIGKELKEIRDDELWKDDYKDFLECAGQFGIKKAQTYNMIKSYEMAIKYKLEDYTPTALIEIGRLDSKKGEKVVKAALEKGQINQGMAVSDVKKFVDKKLGKTQKALATRNDKAVQETEVQETEVQVTEGQKVSPVVEKKQFVCFMLNDGKWDVTSNLEGVSPELMKALKVALKEMSK